MAHIREEMIQEYVNGRLSAEDERMVMEHIAVCDYCATRFASEMAKGALVSPPPDLKQEILKKTVYRTKPVHTVKGVLERKRERRRELLAYSARVAFAMAASIVMLFTMSSYRGQIQQMPQEIVQTSQKTASTWAKEGLVRQKASEKAREDARKKETSGESERKKITDSLQEASGKVGETLSDFWNWLE